MASCCPAAGSSAQDVTMTGVTEVANNPASLANMLAGLRQAAIKVD
jgi:hypothetical protein